MKKNHRTKSEMYPLIEGFASSGMKLDAYCKAHKLNYYTYRYWLRKYKSEKKQDSVKDSSNLNFIPVKVMAPEIKEETLQIFYPNGVQIAVSTVLDMEGLSTLKKLVSCLD
ncbi:IS66 family insertion sequence element accessory protein TnpA [Kordia sp.]|uniref:IS66 family insertion sequence element accessory protein TnpA n=1 Tax=Kordia sp. TaxID=1965332 RepID=UPI003D2C6028